MAKYQQYAEYKDSGVEWLGKIPSHWTMSKLRYLFDFSKGLSITKENLQDEGIPCVNYGEVHSKYGFEVDPKKHLLKCVSENYLKTSENALLNNGDFVFADTSEDLKGSGNFTHLVGDEQIFAGYHTVIARPHNANASRFYAYLFESKEFRSQIHLAVKGVKVFSITQAMLRSANAWLPSTDEQVKIANFLDHETAKIDSLIEKQQQLIHLLKEKRQAVISHAVTKGLNPNVPMKDSGVEWLGEVPEHWTRKSLNYLISHTVDNRGRTPPIVEEGIPMVEVSQVAGNGLYTSDNYSKFVTQKSYEEFVRSDIKENDILFVTVGATFGKTCLVPPSPEFFIAQNIVGFRCVAEVEPKFFMFLLSSSIFKEAISATNKSSTIDNVKVSDLVKTKVVIPPFKEQIEIADYIFKIVDKYESLMREVNTVIKLLQERRTALISSAVTGKIDVRHWQNPNNNNEAKMEFSA
ncbi:restriction endonuclease subunit S [Acinetobacter johnsonii]|uniref:restriction endonuclease subunit S n=1 Tax=Acinetobacter johnsonii TaxID=40214 RepID=UPI002FD88654|nr:restriction endonuclease subunit S [Acinetobacter johnsonii]